MEKIIAYCGLVCSDCEAYLATQAGNRNALEQVAEKWRVEYDAPGITVESVLCDGCLTEIGRKCSHCGECDIRACGMERGVANCAHCPDYACDKVERFFGFVPPARQLLDSIRAGLTM